MKLVLVADKNTVTCFKLAGLQDVYSVKDAEETEKIITQLSEEPDLAVILIAERLVDRVRGAIEKISERKYPLIIPIPDINGAVTIRTDPVIELIRRKAGIEVKL